MTVFTVSDRADIQEYAWEDIVFSAKPLQQAPVPRKGFALTRIAYQEMLVSGGGDGGTTRLGTNQSTQ